MKNFFRFFVERHMFANILTITIILIGLAVLPNINRNTFPDVDLDQVVITSRYEGSSPADIELKVTNKIEDKLKSIDGIKKYVSLSIENVSLIDLEIESDVDDTDEVKDKIREQIDSIVDFPQDMKNRPTITAINSATFPILEVGISSDELPYKELRGIAKRFKTDLENIKGISKIDGYGYLSEEVKITPDPQKMSEFQVSLINLIGVISNRNVRASMGNIKQDNKDATIVNDSRLFSEDDVKNAIVRSNFNGQSVKLSDVALVKLGYETPKILSRVSGSNGISFNLIKSESADIITVSNKILTLVDDYKKQYPNLNFITANDSSKFLKNRLNVMISNGILGLVLVIFVLTFFLNKEMAFWVSLGIPVAVMGVFFLMPLFNMTINIISLLALIIVIGIIVDDGIIVAENIAKFREKGLSATEASIEGIYSVFKPVITTILTTIVAFSPMFFMSGIMGKFIFQIPMVITFALLISLIEVVIALPSHLSSRKSAPKVIMKKRHHIITQLRKKYEHVLTLFLKRKYTVVIGFAGVFVLSMAYAITFMDFVLFPKSNAVNFYVRTEAPAGTPLEKTSELMQPIEDALMQLPTNELQAFTTRVGVTGDAYFLTEQENQGFIMVDLVPFTGRDRSADEIMQEIKLKTENTPGFTNITYQVEAGGPPVGKAINVKVITDNNERRTAVADEVYEYIVNIDGVRSLERNDKKQKSQINLNFNYDTISRLGLTISSIQQTIRTAFSGFNASTMRLGDEDIDFKIEFSDEDKTSLETLNQLLIPNNRGRLIRLSDITDIELTDGSPNYTHYDGKRSISITGDLNTKVITSTKLTQLVKERFKGPEFADINFVYGGESEETNKSVQDLIRSFILAILGIFFLLILLFNSLVQPFLVILTIPFGLIGVIIAFALHGEDLGFISMIGTVGLTGVVVNGSLVLVNHLNEKLTQIPKGSDLIPHVVVGSGDRFRPIVITSISTVAGLLPLAYGLGGSDPFIAPMALAIGYGLLFSTPLTLFLLPALYLILIDITQFIQRLRSKKSTIPQQDSILSNHHSLSQDATT
ncbi:MAG: efflux RND transporter permease subunit [Candidatus Marinamargulisbacteria bacterium]